MHLIIRPNGRALRDQLMGSFCVLSLAVLALWLLEGDVGAPTIVVYGGAILLSVALHAVGFCRGPVAIVATPDFLGLRLKDRTQYRIPWSSILTARHASPCGFLQWELAQRQGATAIVQDFGVASHRWSLLWPLVVREVGRHGGKVFVDPTSNSLYGEADG
jgi:hypothetical protein